MDAETLRAKEHEAMQLFSPGAPIDEDALFAGRGKQIDQIIEAVLQRGQHAIIYGERGVGKTSLARTFRQRLLNPVKALQAVQVNCDPADDYTSLWRKVFADLSHEEGGVLDDFPGQISPDIVRRVLSGFDLNTTPIIVLDEFDKLADREAKALMANTIKSLSDYSVPATLILVGVANSVDGLISEHESISRALVQVPMPRMQAQELEEIIDKRLARLGMKITRPALAQIIGLSSGLPHYTHLLGLYSVRRALNAGKLLIDETHVDEAERLCLEKVDASLTSQYNRATQSHRSGNIYKEVLLACALAEPDERGYFPAKAVEFPLSTIMRKPYTTEMFGQHLKKLNTADRGEVLEVDGTPRRFRYRFEEPLMQPYVILRGLKDGLLDKATMKRLMPNYLQPRLSSL
ncbi:MAG TPA: AAA family ATPase [Usitatibacter sp.]|jgi:Cdc6-like AAA superfamily ATPase|nr:AAA family ATPase [Usitatibacter sp.]